MDDLISRKALCEYALNQKDKSVTPNDIIRFPSAQPERKKGKWIDMDSDLEKYDDIKCSCCKHEFTVDAYHWTDIGFIKDDLNFCPNCGADMRSDEMIYPQVDGITSSII